MDFHGPEWNLGVLFNGIKSLLLSELSQKIIFTYDGYGHPSSISNIDSNIPFRYRDYIQENDYIKISLPKIKLWFYNHEDKECTMMIAHKVKLEIWNDNWRQMGGTMFLTQMKFFKAGEITIIKDEESMEEVENALKTGYDCLSFLAFKFNLTIQLPKQSK